MRSVFDLAQKNKRIFELEAELEKPNFWNDTVKAKQQSKELSGLKETIKTFENLRKEFVDLSELATISANDEGALRALSQKFIELEEKIKKERFKVFLSGKYDRGNAILTITAGAGGKDSEDWAKMLLRMYQKFCERKKWNTSIIHESPGQVSVEIKGAYGYGFLKGENGVHRLVRISPFSAKSLRHTSFAGVEVLPEISGKEEHIEIKPEDITIDVSRASGPGGQNVNKRETAVRIVHIKTGIAVESQTQRSQQQNKERAMEILVAKLYRLKELEREKELETLRQAQGKGKAIEWGSQIRSYVLHPYQMVKDHRTNTEVSNAQDVLNGNLDDFIHD